MTSRDFVYWLQGYFEINGQPGTGILTESQVDCIRKHLAMVFVHEIDPSFPKCQQLKLGEAHAGDPVVKPFDPHTDSTTLGGVGPGGLLYRC